MFPLRDSYVTEGVTCLISILFALAAAWFAAFSALPTNS